ncbi:hypothetical protein V6N13_088062 [Hibiscus sabdariffa]|uniref:Uncharacterized protein n=1 Tax=Hibiscus sabdariffa TaxID=183260 RepID=A0ABR2FYB4_9ROSI
MHASPSTFLVSFNNKETGKLDFFYPGKDDAEDEDDDTDDAEGSESDSDTMSDRSKDSGEEDAEQHDEL